jgi:hypothetical protein
VEQGEIELGPASAAPDLPGPFAVGRYARKLKGWMGERPRVQLIGEVTGVGRSKVQAYFELRDGEGAVPCAIWLNDLEKAGLPEGALRDGAELVISGGLDYYPGGGQASPNFSFRATRFQNELSTAHPANSSAKILTPSLCAVVLRSAMPIPSR